MTEATAADCPLDNEPGKPTPPDRIGYFEDLIGTFPECDDEFRRVIMEARKFRRRKEVEL